MLRRVTFLVGFGLVLGSLVPLGEVHTFAQDLPRDPARAVLDGVTLLDRPMDKQIGLMIEEGSFSPAQLLLTLDREREVVLKLQGGPARFVALSEDGQGPIKTMKRVTYRADVVGIPEIDPVSGAQQASWLSITVDGTLVADPISVGTIASEIFELIPAVPAIRSGLLLYDDVQRYYVVDPLRFDFSLPQTPVDGRPWPPPWDKSHEVEDAGE